MSRLIVSMPKDGTSIKHVADAGTSLETGTCAYLGLPGDRTREKKGTKLRPFSRPRVVPSMVNHVGGTYRGCLGEAITQRTQRLIRPPGAGFGTESSENKLKIPVSSFLFGNGTCNLLTLLSDRPGDVFHQGQNAGSP